MRIRFRLGPFTFGRSGTRLSIWRRATGFSIPLFKRNAGSFGKIRLGIFSFYFNRKSKKRVLKKAKPRNFSDKRKINKEAYEPWTIQADKKLAMLFREGKTLKDLSELFGRSNGAIRSRINKLELKEKYGR